MKGMKKLLSILMVLTLVLSLGASALAATVTIPNAEGLPNTHTYTAYQIFTGTQNGAETALGDIKWGSDINSGEFLTALTTAPAPLNGFTAGMTAAEVAAQLGTLGDVAAEAFGRLALEHLKGDGTELKADPATGNATADLAKGYYVIKDTTTTLGENEVRNDIVVQVVDNMVITAKNEKPSSEKKVKEVNDTTGTTSSWQDAADHDINDKIEYRLMAKVPVKALKAYDNYMLNFVDVISAGLTYDTDSYQIEVGGTGEKNTGTKLTGSEFNFSGPTEDTTYTGGHKLTWSCNDIKAIQAVKDALGTAGDNDFVYIYIYYTATLNDKAVIAGEGNPNKFRIEYNRNPDGSEEGYTPWDINIVFTFDTLVNKVDESGTKALEGAGFTLLKVLPDTDSNSVTLGSGEDAKTYPHTKQIGAELKGSSMTEFNFSGLDSGKYILVESTVPAGYNKAADIEFEVEATYDSTGENPKLTGLVVKDKAGTEISGIDGSFTVTTTPTDNKGSITTTVKNQKGATLPETGGIGTTIFYVAGAILVAGAAILLVTKKRVNGADK